MMGILITNNLTSDQSKERKHIPEDDPHWYEVYWVENIYPFEIYSTKHHPDLNESTDQEGSIFIGKDKIKAEIVSLTKLKEFFENGLFLIPEIDKKLEAILDKYPEKII